MKDSKEKEARISNLKDMINNISNDKEDDLGSFEDENIYEYDDSSDDYEIVDAEDMINTLSEDYDKYSNEELTIDDEYIYKPSEDTAHVAPLKDNGKIDENYIIKTKLEHSNFPEDDDYKSDYGSSLTDFPFGDVNQEEYINEKFDNILTKKVGKYSILAILGLIVGIILIIFAILMSLSSSQRIIDNVSSGEVNTSVAIFLLIGLLFVILSVYKLIAIKSPFDNVINSMKSVDEENVPKTSKKKKEEVVIEQKPLANDHKKVKKIGEFDISNIKQKIEEAPNKNDEVKHKTESRPDSGKIEDIEEPQKKELTEEEKEYEKAKLDSESIDEIFADMKEIEDVPIISIDSKEE